MTETKSKAVEKTEKPQVGPSHSAASSQQAGNAVSTDLSGSWRVQRAAGNLAVQRILQWGVIQAKLPMSQPGDSHEQEADRVAEQILHMQTAPCVCGGGCTRCQEKSRDVVQRKMQTDLRREGLSIPNTLANRLGSGQPLQPATRVLMEHSFGQDFGQVRVHIGTEANVATRTIGASAFTIGPDIAFESGKYTPDTSEGQRLLAHELTHVVQQGHASANQTVQPSVARSAAVHKPTKETEQQTSLLGHGEVASDVVQVRQQTQPHLARDDKPGEIDSYTGFVAGVFARATSRLNENIQKLDEWRQYIATQFNDVELKAQMAAAEDIYLFQRALATGRGQFYEQREAARSPASRALNENVINGLINGGCQYCHESNVVWDWNARHSDEFRNAPTTAQSLSLIADYTELQRIIRGGRPVQGQGQVARPSAIASTPSALTASSISQMPTAMQPPTGGKPPAPLQYPRPHSDLCGPLPNPETGPEPAPFDPQAWGPNTALALQAVSRIGTVLEPLGPFGYRVLPQGIFSTLYNRGPAALRADVMSNIQRRQDNYRQLQSLIAMGKVPYTELCPIVDELLPSATPKIQFWVIYEIVDQRVREALLDIIMGIVGAALLLFAVVFPPGAVLLAGAGLALAQIGVGMRDVRRGSQYELGIGAGVYSPEQEASAEALIAGGYLNIGTGIAGLGMSAFGGVQWLRSRPGGALIPARSGPQPSGRFNPLPDGSYVAFHPQNPDFVVLLEGDQLTAGVLIEGEFHPLATARSPWPGGTPPEPPGPFVGGTPARPVGSASPIPIEGSPAAGVLEEELPLLETRQTPLLEAGQTPPSGAGSLAEEEIVWVNTTSRGKVYHRGGVRTKNGYWATRTEAELAGYRPARGDLEAARRGVAEHAMVAKAMKPYEGQLHAGGWRLEGVEKVVGRGRVDELWVNDAQKRVFVADTYTGPYESLEHFRKGWNYSNEPMIMDYIRRGYTYDYRVAIKHPSMLH